MKVVEMQMAEDKFMMSFKVKQCMLINGIKFSKDTTDHDMICNRSQQTKKFKNFSQRPSMNSSGIFK